MERYTDAVCDQSPWYHPACSFVLEWLDEIRKNMKRKRIQYKVGNAYSKTMKRWLEMYGDDDMSVIGAHAHKIMERIRKSHPEIDWR